MCRDFIQKNSCPRGVHCTFAHSKAEMDKYRAKSRHPNSFILPLTTSTNTIPTTATQQTTTLPMFSSTNPNNLLRPIPPQTTILPIWNQQQQQQTNPINDLPQQHHHQ